MDKTTARPKTGFSPSPFVREGVLELRANGLAAELGLAILTVGVATVVAWALTWLAPGVLPGALLFPALLIASVIGGWRSGLAAGVLGFATRALVMRAAPDPIFSSETPNLANLLIFALAISAVVAIGSYVHFLLDRLHSGRDEMIERNLRYATLFETVPEGFAVCEAIRDDEGKLVDYSIIEINPALRSLLNVGPEVVGSRLSDSPYDWTRWLKLCDQVLTTGEPVVFERFNRPYKLWHEVHLSRLSEGQLAQFFFDITARKANEARQAELFEELNHRVKNNLAIVAGVLQLQARESEERTRGELMKAAARVQTIAEIHGALTHGSGADSVDFAAYLEALCLGLRRSLASDREIDLGLRADPALVKVEAAIPLGMVVNELVTNAVKYAYPAPKGGPIDVRFRHEGGEIFLTVRDAGRGLPEDAERRNGGLGMRLVRSLVEQIGGELTVRGDAGAYFEIRLRNELPAAPVE
ncbi:MAG TPA: sensor histidine kinase [Caulobacteraceae bacterium]|jgi:two-component sensor histidine kinase